MKPTPDPRTLTLLRDIKRLLILQLRTSGISSTQVRRALKTPRNP